MKGYNYDKLMSMKPVIYEGVVNSRNQVALFLEHPTRGDEATIIVAFPEFKAAFDSEFWDLEDMTKNEDYEPILHDGKLWFAFEFC